jgi:hypothetical protein
LIKARHDEENKDQTEVKEWEIFHHHAVKEKVSYARGLRVRLRTTGIDSSNAGR